jgi:hypothetical protein
LPRDTVVTSLALHHCKIGKDEHKTVHINDFTVLEEAVFSGMDLQNYQSLSSLLKSVYIDRCESTTDVSCFRHLQKVNLVTVQISPM